MHLVDAIRIASKQAEIMKQPNDNPQQHAVADTKQVSEDVIPGTSEVREPHEINSAVVSGAGTVVRLELFLSPEQMHQMLRGILQGAHTVMTLREAAQHLRTNASSLVQLAESGEIPAFMVDGQWKFPRQGVDEWITLQTLSARLSNTSQEDEDAA